MPSNRLSGTPSKPAPKPLKATLVGDLLTIPGSPTKSYLVQRLSPDGAIGNAAFRLTTEAGGNYDVIARPWGIECDCWDYQTRRDGIDPNGCKHIRALAEVGLLEYNG